MPESNGPDELRPAGLGTVGVVPKRTNDPEDAFLLMQIDGASILEWTVGGPAASSEGARTVLSSHLRAIRQPALLRPNPKPNSGTYFDSEVRTVYAESETRQSVHIDGYMLYGEAYPDFIFLLCEAQAEQGGESFLIDNQRLSDLLASTQATRRLAEFLWRVPVDNSAPGRVAHRCPIANRTRGGRVAVRRHQEQRVLETSSSNSEHEQRLRQWFDVTDAAVELAPRFTLQPGDLLCVDNYRAARGRERFADRRRLLHRIWAWSDMSFGVPDPDSVAAAAELERISARPPGSPAGPGGAMVSATLWSAPVALTGTHSSQLEAPGVANLEGGAMCSARASDGLSLVAAPERPEAVQWGIYQSMRCHCST